MDVGIGHRLKQARARTGDTQIDLAGRTGVGLRTIRQIEQTDFEPRLGHCTQTRDRSRCPRRVVGVWHRAHD